jgi:hypothetical protein
MTNCPTCNAKNEPTAVFCSQCATNLAGGVRYNPHAHAAPPPPQQYGGYGYTLPSRASTVLTLGILSLVVCGIMGPIAWAMGSEELRRIDRGETDPTTRGTVVAGRVCGIIASALMIVSVLVIVFVMLAASTATRHYGGGY